MSLVVLCLPLLAALVASESGYEVTKKIEIPGQGGRDYLTIDDAARRLYVSHGTQVEVLDVDSGTIVGKIANTLPEYTELPLLLNSAEDSSAMASLPR